MEEKYVEAHTGSQELVSVIVPAYNAAATIGEALESALAQTYPDLEVITVDDGSTDATADIVTSFAARDPRVRLLRQANAGVAVARNLAIAHARGAYVAPLDADDLWHPEKLALQVAAMRRGGPRVGLVYCWWRDIDATGRVIANKSLPYPHEGNMYAALILGNPIRSGSIPLIRRPCLAEAGCYDPDLRGACEDLKLYLRLAERYDFALVRRHLVGYRRAPGTASSDTRRMVRAHKIVLAEARRRHPDLPDWLFRLGVARFEYQQGRSCLRRGKLLLGLGMLLNALRRDPAAVPYRLAEHPYRALSRRLPERLAGPPLAMPIDGGAPSNFGRRGRMFGYDAQARWAGGSPMPPRPVDLGGRMFLAVEALPLPGSRICSSLYAWRCEMLAASVDSRHRPSPGCEVSTKRSSNGLPGRQVVS